MPLEYTSTTMLQNTPIHRHEIQRLNRARAIEPRHVFRANKDTPTVIRQIPQPHRHWVHHPAHIAGTSCHPLVIQWYPNRPEQIVRKHVHAVACGVVCNDVRQVIANYDSEPVVEKSTAHVAEAVDGSLAVHPEPYVCVWVRGRA